MNHILVEPFIIILCSFFADGSINCDEIWTLYIWDMKTPPTCGTDSRTLGCVLYADIPWVNEIVSPQIHVGNGTYTDELGLSIIQHEIQHLRCLCNFHADPPEPPKR